jgi:hypothetical protein
MGRKSRLKRQGTEGANRAEAVSAPAPLTIGAGTVPPGGLAILGGAFLLSNLLTVRFGFVYDDFPIIVENTRLHSLDRLGEVFSHGYWPDRPGLTLFRPVVQGLWAFLWALGGGSPFIFHLAALLFAVLPIHVEATASVVGMSETMAASLGLAALLMYSQGRRELAFLLWLPAVFTKESAAALSALLPLLWNAEEKSLPSRRRLVTEGTARPASCRGDRRAHRFDLPKAKGSFLRRLSLKRSRYARRRTRFRWSGPSIMTTMSASTRLVERISGRVSLRAALESAHRSRNGR